MTKQRSYKDAIKILSQHLLKRNIVLNYHPDNEKIFNDQVDVVYSEKYCYHKCIECDTFKKTKYSYLREYQCLKCIVCGGKSGSKKTSYSYDFLIERTISSFKNKNINLEIHPNNELLFNSQSTNPNNKLCEYKCPNCLKYVKTAYSLLKDGQPSCHYCKSKKISQKLSYTYQEMIDKIKKESNNKNINLEISDDNLNKFNTQTLMPSRRLCYHKCPCCGDNKETTYSCLMRGVSFFCKSCVGSINENIFSVVLSDLIVKLISYYNLQEVKVYNKNNKYNLDIQGRKLVPDFFIKTNHGMGLIEYHGRQHFESIEKWGGEEKFKKQKIRDQLLIDYCNSNKINYHQIDGRKINYNQDSFVNYFRSDDFINYLSNLFLINVKEFIEQYEFKENLNIYVKHNLGLYADIIKLHFKDFLTEKEIANKLSIKRKLVNKIMHLYLDGSLKIQLDEHYTLDDYNKINKQNRIRKIKESTNGSAKLDEQKVIDILSRIKDGQSDQEIAKFYSVTRNNINMIRNNRSWKHLSR